MMFDTSLPSRFALLLAVTVTFSSLPANGLLAQDQNKPQQKKPDKVKIDGEFIAARGNLVKIKKGNEEWLLKVTSKPESIVFRGEADPSWVRPGMFVTFEAKLDPKGFSEDPIKEVSVFTPGENTEFGLIEEGSGGLEGFSLGEDEPMEVVEAPEEEKADEDDEGKKTYTVVGQVRSVAKTGRWEITGDKRKRIANVLVAEDAKVDVELYAPPMQLIQPGDKFKATGSSMEKGKAIVSGELEIEAVKKLTGEKKTRRGSRD